MVSYSAITKCPVHQCEHTVSAGCLMCRQPVLNAQRTVAQALGASASMEDYEIHAARMLAEHDEESRIETRVDAVDLMSRVASYRSEVGVSKWGRS